MNLRDNQGSGRSFFKTFFWDKYFSLGFALGLTLQPLEIMDLMFSTLEEDTITDESEVETIIVNDQISWNDVYRSSVFIWFLISWFIIGSFIYLRTIDILLKVIFILVDTKYSIQLAAINETLFGLWYAGAVVSSWLIFQSNSACISRRDCPTPFFLLLTTLMDSTCGGGPEDAPCGIFSINVLLRSYCPVNVLDPEAISECEQLFQEYIPGISITVISGLIVTLFYFLFHEDQTIEED